MSNDAPQIPIIEGIRSGIIESATGQLEEIFYEDNGNNTGRLARRN